MMVDLRDEDGMSLGGGSRQAAMRSRVGTWWRSGKEDGLKVKIEGKKVKCGFRATWFAVLGSEVVLGLGRFLYIQ